MLIVRVRFAVIKAGNYINKTLNLKRGRKYGEGEI